LGQELDWKYLEGLSMLDDMLIALMLEFYQEEPTNLFQQSVGLFLHAEVSLVLRIRKGNECFYNEYQIMIKCYLHQYKKCLLNSVVKTESFECEHNNFNRYMSSNDPAFGILKSYFNKDFTERYIQEFLFN
jgi:hypothetical protein